MRTAILVGVLVLSWTSLAHSAFAETVQKALCAPGIKTRVVPPTFEGTATKDALQSRVKNSNFCTDDRLTLGPLGQIQEASTCICETQEEMDQVGCGPDQQQPRVTISIKKAISGCVTDNVIISKCAKDPKAAYEAQCKSGVSRGDDIDDENSVTVERTPWTLDDLPTLTVPSETDAMISALTYAGVSSSDAERLSAQSPVNAQEYIRALVEGDTAAIKASAAKLEINPNLSRDIAMLVPPATLPGASDVPHRGAEADPLPTSTGFGPADSQRQAWTGDFPTQCGIPGIAGLIMGPESGCGRATRNPRADVRGPYQFLCGTWNTYARNTGYGQYSCSCTSGGYYAGECSAVDDPQIGALVVNAQYDRYRVQYGDYCSSINQRWETCAYAIHFAGEAGFQRLVQTYRANPSTPLDPGTVATIFGSSGAYAANREVFAASGSVGGLFANMESKLRGNGYVTSTHYSPTGVSTNTGYSLNPNFGGAFAAQTGPVPSQTPVVMSPFANASLFSGLAAQTQQNAAQYTPQQVAPVVNPPTYPKAEVSLTVDPRIGNAGDRFKFTWKSSAINQSIPCTLALPGSTTVPVSPNGTQTVTIKNPNVYALVFTCRGLDGRPAVAQDTVFVQ